MNRPAFADWLSSTNDVTQIFLSAGSVPGLINLGGGLPEPALWPVGELAALSAQMIRDRPTEALGYGPVPGLPVLRDAIAERFGVGGLRLTRDNVLVTSGGMQALDLVGKVLLEPGGLVAAQAPTYLGALDAWRPLSPAFRPMRLEAPDFDPAAALAGVRFGYTVPNFSNPTGRLVGLREREALVAAAHATGTWLVEDDPYGTLHYDSARLPSMLSLSGARGEGAYDGPVVYLGTLSKELAPGFRVGWVVAAPRMIAALAMAKQGSDMCTSGLSQVIAAEAFRRGIVDRLLPDILALYRRRRDALCGALERYAAGLLEWKKPEGGMFVWATATDPALDTDQLLRTALKNGVCISPSSVFDPAGSDRRSIRINFTLNAEPDLEEGARRLAAAIEATLAERNRP